MPKTITIDLMPVMTIFSQKEYNFLGDSQRLAFDDHR